MDFLKRTVGTWTKEDLLQFTTGRREVIWVLEHIVVYRDLFADSAKLLLALGEAENESYANSASGVFIDLFSNAPGQVAPTEASPQERFPILKEALEAKSKERRLISLRACDQALESQHFVLRIGTEWQDLRREPQRWNPRTYGELFEAYRRVWHLLCDQLDRMPQDEQQQAVNILLKRARGLVRFPNLSDMVIETFIELPIKSFIDKKKILAEIIHILHYDGKILPIDVRKSFEELKDKITGNDFSSLLKRYVAMDLLEDQFDEKGNQVDQTQTKIEELAQQAFENKEILLPELDWLVTVEARNGFRLGYELGKRDNKSEFLPILLQAQRNKKENASVYFLGGYFRAIRERKQEEWESQMDALMEDKIISICIPELTWRSGMSDRAAMRILKLAKEGVISFKQFQIFSYGGITRDISKNVFKKWIECLLGNSDALAISIAMN